MAVDENVLQKVRLRKKKNKPGKNFREKKRTLFRTVFDVPSRAQCAAVRTFALSTSVPPQSNIGECCEPRISVLWVHDRTTYYLSFCVVIDRR